MSTIAQQLLDEMIAEAIAEKRAIIKAEQEQMVKEIIINLLNSTNLTKSEIALSTMVTLQEVEAIAQELNSSTRPTI